GVIGARPIRRVMVWVGITSRDGQITTLLVLVCSSLLIVLGAYSRYDWVPVSTFFLPLLLGSLLLRFWPLLVLVAFDAVAVVVVLNQELITTVRLAVILTLTVFAAIILLAASRRRGSLPSLMGESMLIDLREGLRAQGELPVLPPGWYAESALRSAEGEQFAGDFLVAALREHTRTLEVVVVDVSGQGLRAVAPA